MKKYFVTADPHGFFSIMHDELIKQGWDDNNKDHHLIICGDIFDRGPEPYEMFEFLNNLGDRFIFVRGNHEDLFEDCLEQLESGESASYHHIHNGTLKTIEDLAVKTSDNKKYLDLWLRAHDLLQTSEYKDRSGFKEIYAEVRKQILDWINSKALNYYETNNYIFVHGWIPYYETFENKFTYNPNWRDSDQYQWESARWKNGMEAWHKGVKEVGKTIVCGHWHCSFGNSHYHLESKLKEFPKLNTKKFNDSFKPFVDEGIIALDACTGYSNKINVITIED